MDTMKKLKDIFMFVIILFIIYCVGGMFGYKNGQVDCMEDKIKYELNSDESWVCKDAGTILCF